MDSGLDGICIILHRRVASGLYDRVDLVSVVGKRRTPKQVKQRLDTCLIRCTHFIDPTVSESMPNIVQAPDQ